MIRAAMYRALFFIQSGVIAAGLAILAIAPGALHAQTDCLTCHGDATMTDAAGHSIAVDGQKFSASIHGSLQCSNCHADIKDYPHPDKIAPVDCKTCHADQAAALKAACMPTARSIPAPVATATRTRSFPRPTRARRSIRSMFPRPAATATATAAWRRSTACRVSTRSTWTRFTASRSARKGCWWRPTARAATARTTF